MPVERAGMVYWRLSAPLFRMWFCCGSLASYPLTVTSIPWWELATLTVCLAAALAGGLSFKTCLSCTERHVPGFPSAGLRGLLAGLLVLAGRGAVSGGSPSGPLVPWAMHCWVSFRELFAVSKTEPVNLSLVSFLLGMISLPHLGALLPACKLHATCRSGQSCRNCRVNCSSLGQDCSLDSATGSAPW